MNIIGAHVILYSKNAELDRDFVRDILGFAHVDVGGGWLIFALPPAEVAVHPSNKNDVHEFYLMCEDVNAFIAAMAERKVECAPIHEERWGSLTHVMLPSGSKLGVYQAKHASPTYVSQVRSKNVRAKSAKVAAKSAQRVSAKSAKKVSAKSAKKAPAKSAQKAPAKKPVGKKKAAKK